MKFNKKSFVILSLTTIFVTNAFAYKMVGAAEANPEVLQTHSNMDFNYNQGNNIPKEPAKNKVVEHRKNTKTMSLYKKIILKEKLKNIVDGMNIDQKIKFLKKQKKAENSIILDDIKFKTKLLDYKIQLLDNRLKKLTNIPYNDLKNELYIYINDPTVIVKKVDYNKIVQGQNDKLLLRYLLARDTGLVNEQINAKAPSGFILGGGGQQNAVGGGGMLTPQQQSPLPQ